jgi:hypothetical protein
VNPHQVKTWEEVESWLRSKGFVPTPNLAPAGGRYWVSKSKRHIVVPNDIDGFYPDVLWQDLYRRAQQIIP